MRAYYNENDPGAAAWLLELAFERLIRACEPIGPCYVCGARRSVQDAYPVGRLCDLCFQQLLFRVMLPGSLFAGRKS